MIISFLIVDLMCHFTIFQVNSIYHMKRPDDLLALMEQEKRMAFLESLKYEMSEQTLDAVEQRHESGLESKLFYEDDDCLKARVSLAEFDLFESTLVLPDSEAVKQAGGPFLSSKPALTTYQSPNCTLKQETFVLKNIDNLHVRSSIVSRTYHATSGCFRL